MITVKEATPEMFPKVYPLLQQFNVNNPSITREDWRGLFNYPWRHSQDPLGYVLADGETIVGYLGTLCSRRLINGREEKLCNITSWVTHPSHRQHAISLLTPVIRLGDYTIINHSPAKHVHPLFSKLGFKELERKRAVLYPIPGFGTLAKPSRFRATTNKEFIAARLREPEAKIFRDHASCQCGHLLIHNDSGYCYAIFTRTKGRRYHFSHVHYISNKNVFFSNLNKVRFHLMKAGRAWFTMIDARFLEGRSIPRSKMAQWAKPTLFKSGTLQPDQIDNLYSELILLHL